MVYRTMYDLHGYFTTFKNEIIEYLESHEFISEYTSWQLHNGNDASAFRVKLKSLIHAAKARFPIHTSTLDTIFLVFEHCICAQITMVWSIFPNDVAIAKALPYEVATYTIERVYPSLYDDLHAEYVTYVCACTKVQRAWRRCISDPAYLVCRKRLYTEFVEMST